MGLEDKKWTTELDFSDRDYNQFSDYHRNIKKTTDDLVNTAKSVETKTAIEKITLSVLLSTIVYNSSMDANRVAATEKMSEHLLGLVLTRDGTSTDSGFKDLARGFGIMKASFFLSQSINTDEGSEIELYRDLAERGMLGRKLSTGGFVMTELLFESARRAYKPFEKAMKDVNGFDIHDAIVFTQFIERIDRKMKLWLLNESSLTKNGILSRVNPVEIESSEQFYYKTEKFQKDCNLVNDFYQSVNENMYSIWYTEEMLVNRLPDKYDCKKFESYLNRMSVEIDEAKRVSKPRYPSDFNPVNKHPLIKRENRYLVPIPNNLRYSLVNTFYYDLMEQPDIGNQNGSGGGKFGNKFGNYLEEWTFDILGKQYGYGRVSLNPEYQSTGEEAADVLIEGKNTLFSIQCKTAKIPLEAQQSDFRTIEEEIKKKAGEGYSQAVELIQKVWGKSTVELKNRELTSYTECIPIVVVGTPHNDISTFYFDLLVKDDGPTPFVIDIYDLVIVVSCLPDVGQFIDYVNKRREVIEKKSHYSADELDYLGLYLELGYFPDSDNHEMMFLRDHVENVLRYLDAGEITLDDYFD